MLFSVVIPVFNRNIELKRALDSLSSQHYKNMEVIVVNDGSSLTFTRSIESIISNVKDLDVKLISYEVNINGSHARNVGIYEAKGEYICFLDSDDEWANDKLKVLKDFITEKPDNDFFYNQYKNISGHKVSEPLPKNGIKQNESVAEYTFIRNFGRAGIQSSCICIKASLAKKHLFNSQLNGHQDWDFVIRIAEDCPELCFIESPLTLRHVDDIDEAKVSTSLSYDFSLKFLHTIKRHFTFKAMAAYAVYILIPKKFMSIEQGLSINRFELLAFIFFPFKALSGFFKFFKFERRYNKVKILCLQNGYHRVALVGWNSYSRLISKKLISSGIEVICVVDKFKSGNSNSQIKIFRYEELTGSFLGKNQCFITMTDVHQVSMKSDLLKYIPDAIVLHF